MNAINPSSIKSLGHYIADGRSDKLRRDTDFWFNPKVLDRIFSSEKESISSIDRLNKHHRKQKEIRSRWKSLR